jgi:tetratricopeptide (TPR) repeat protein
MGNQQASQQSNPQEEARSPEVVALLQQALALHMQGQLDQARDGYLKLLEHHPGQFDAVHLLGYIAHQRGDHERAVELIRHALEINPTHATAHLNLGNALAALQHQELALACFERALQLRPDYADAHMNRGNLFARTGQPDEALLNYDSALRVNPEHVDVLINRSNVLRTLGRPHEAMAGYELALQLRPNSAPGHYNRGNIMQDLQRHAEAIVCYDQAFAADPNFAEAANNRSVSLLALDRTAEALNSVETALALKPDYPFAIYNRGNALRDLGRYDEALACYAEAQRRTPDYARAHWNEALCRLMIGDFEQGWKKHEWRWKTDTFTSPFRGFAEPLWLGDASLQGKTILLHAEQGFGDTLQFCRYSRLVAALGATVVLEVQPALRSLLAQLEGVAQLVTSDSPLPPFDYQCPLMSLPAALHTTLATIPAAPYLVADPVQAEAWRDRLGTRSRPRVGLAWSGNSSHVNDRKRSIALAQVVPLVSGKLHFISLQKEVRVSDQATLDQHPEIFDPRDQLGDFADMAALISELDLVITVDTAVAHLAGALGKPVWLLLPAIPDWRWLLERDDSPWYASARLFRQPAPLDWDSVIAHVSQALAEIAPEPAIVDYPH